MTSSRSQYVQFALGHEHYAIPISEVNEIIRMQEISRIPNVKPYVKGVINLRGNIIPVISLRSLFNMPEDEYTKQTRIIVVHHHDETIGVIVDQIDKVTTFEDIQPPPARFGELNGVNFTGIGINGPSIVGILDLNYVLLKEGEQVEQP
jgi:purine-binding chemotaxis protein CheW